MKGFDSLPVEWRPRERLFRFGPQGMSLPELWSCILGVGRKDRSVQQLAEQLAKHENPATQTPQELQQQLGKSQAARVLAVFELQKRYQDRQHLIIRGLEDVLLLAQELLTARQEQILCFYLSATNELLHTEKIALGTLNAALLQPRDLFYPIRQHPVAALILCHNHPSGDATPSPEDHVFTARVQAACELLGIDLYDHVVVGRKGHYSFRAEKKLGSE